MHEREDNHLDMVHGKPWDPEAALASLAGEKSIDADASLTKLAERLVEENLPTAVMAVVHLSQYGSSDAIRLKAAQYLIDRGLGRPGLEGITGGKVDPFEVFLADCVADVSQGSPGPSPGSPVEGSSGGTPGPTMDGLSGEAE